MLKKLLNSLIGEELLKPIHEVDIQAIRIWRSQLQNFQTGITSIFFLIKVV